MATRKGIITFGLVSIPVELHVAARSQSLDLDLLHEPCKTRIRYRLYCPTHERDVDRKEVVKGYKTNGGYVVVEDADFEKAERASSRAIEVVAFVEEAAVDPMYLERSYFVGPQSDAERPYEVLLEAMRRSKKAAVVTFVMANRQQYALLRTADDRLTLHTIYYGDEVRDFEADWKRARPSAEEVKFAERLIEAMVQEFKPDAYRDEYREKLLAIIRAKAKGEEVELPEAPRAPRKTVSLMSALRGSLDAMRKPLAKAEGQAAARSRKRPRARTRETRRRAA
jgi:DNA end-binding protein Ku